MNAKDLESLPLLVQITAHTHISMLEAAFPGLLATYYVVGSAALGDFHAEKSDVDFVALVNRKPSATEIKELNVVHRHLHNKRLLAGLDGFYINKEDIKESIVLSCPRFNEGKYHGPKRFHASSPDGWALKQYGVCMFGQMPGGLPFNVDWGVLRQGMLENLDTYWRNWARGCRKLPIKALALSLRPKAVEWGVLGISRLYFSLREQDVISKSGAGEYALSALPEHWHPIIREALSIRSGGQTSSYKSVAKRRNDALEYVEFVMRECRTLTPTPLSHEIGRGGNS